MVKGASRLACYGLDGRQKWSVDLDHARVFDVVAISEQEVVVAAIETGVSKLHISRYNTQGQLVLSDDLAFSHSVLAVGANSTDVYALDFDTNLLRKRFGGSDAIIQLPAAFDTPIIGGLKPPAIIASVHCLSDQVILLDHVKARTVAVLEGGGYRPGQLSDPRIDAAVKTQDSDVQSRAALPGFASGAQLMTFPISIFMAASNRTTDVWVVTSLGLSTIPLLRFNMNSGKNELVQIQAPSDRMLNGKPPLMFAASSSQVALGYREGAVALVTQIGGAL